MGVFKAKIWVLLVLFLMVMSRGMGAAARVALNSTTSCAFPFKRFRDQVEKNRKIECTKSFGNGEMVQCLTFLLMQKPRPTKECCVAATETWSEHPECLCKLAFYLPGSDIFSSFTGPKLLKYCNMTADLCYQCPSLLGLTADSVERQPRGEILLVPVAMGCFVFFVAVAMVVIFIVWRRKVAYLRRMPEREEILGIESNLGKPVLFSFNVLKKATNEFHVRNKLGQGGFGVVYKGVLRDGLEVAVKKLSTKSKQGKEEFKNEVILITTVQHRNLVKLRGCCIKGQERLLVYEYLENKSLYQALFESVGVSSGFRVALKNVGVITALQGPVLASKESGRQNVEVIKHSGEALVCQALRLEGLKFGAQLHENRAHEDPAGNRLHLDWRTRVNILVGTARGLAYLHEGCQTRIVHRDIKSSNILLDKNLNAKIADFGLARLFADDQTHVSTRVAGTVGYLSPEYAMRGQLSEKVDVFSFGIVALELVSGRSNFDTQLPTDQAYLLDWTWMLHENRSMLDMLDPLLVEAQPEEVSRVIDIALMCTQSVAAMRPSMARVVSMLIGQSQVETRSVVKPTYHVFSSTLSRQASMDYLSRNLTSRNDASAITVVIPR